MAGVRLRVGVRVRTATRQLHKFGRRDGQLAGGGHRPRRAEDAALLRSEEEATLVVDGHGCDAQLAWLVTADATIAPLTPSVPQVGRSADASGEALTLLTREDAELCDVRGKRVVGRGRRAEQLHCRHRGQQVHPSNSDPSS